MPQAPERYVWKLEYYNGYPNIRFTFNVVAETFEEAVRIGDEAVRNLYRTGTVKVREVQ